MKTKMVAIAGCAAALSMGLAACGTSSDVASGNNATTITHYTGESGYLPHGNPVNYGQDGEFLSISCPDDAPLKYRNWDGVHQKKTDGGLLISFDDEVPAAVIFTAVKSRHGLAAYEIPSQEVFISGDDFGKYFDVDLAAQSLPFSYCGAVDNHDGQGAMMK